MAQHSRFGPFVGYDLVAAAEDAPGVVAAERIVPIHRATWAPSAKEKEVRRKRRQGGEYFVREPPVPAPYEHWKQEVPPVEADLLSGTLAEESSRSPPAGSRHGA
jgi:hypothetical protein